MSTCSQELLATYHDGRIEPFKYLYRHSTIDVIMTHGAMHIIPTYLAISDPNRTPYFVVNFAWYVDRAALNKIAAELEKILAIDPRCADRMLFLLNSQEELRLFTNRFPKLICEFVSNNFSLSEKVFDITNDEKIYEYIYTARPLKFKNHYLAPKIGNSILISDDPKYYIDDPQFVDIGKEFESTIVTLQSPPQVAKLINKSYCGLILSLVEGACYASTEYLLCGIPVISTKSHGGRHEYYNEQNCVLVPPEPDEIKLAVAELVGKMRARAIDSFEIRSQCLNIQQKFRRTLAAAIESLCGLPKADTYNDICRSCHVDQKLQSRINYWTASISLRS